MENADAEPGPLPADIQTFLDTALPYRPRVDALLAAVEHLEPGLITLVRDRVYSEADPFVLAAMASAIGRLGDASDHLRLRWMLDQEDDRVVANALDAMMTLGIPLERISALELISRRDARVAGNALVRLGQDDLTAALEYVRKHYRQLEHDHRKSFVHAIKRMPREGAVTHLLLDLFEWEDRAPLLRTIAGLLEHHLLMMPPGNVGPIIQPLYFIMERCRGGKASLLDQLLYMFAPESRARGRS